MEFLISILGWVGSFEILLAFGLNTYQKIDSKSVLYLILNLTGGTFLIIYSFYYSAYANTFINVIWVIVAIIALARLVLVRSKS
jgi:hypothetical protein